MKSAVALKKYLEVQPHGMPTSTGDLSKLKQCTSSEEWEQMGKDACEVLGVEWTPPGS